MSLDTPARFLTVAYGTPIDIGFLPKAPDGQDGRLLTLGWQAKLGTSFLPYDPEDELIGPYDSSA
ncbi:hypothetical protein Pth03_52630 [Planotetraspora thailandica]|uniref:Uncharacterized protein n=1 Tax=Planotetraspora thailandica TaxID=487172 RepID=A0A8J3V363_9ACTN|nr:hypothetical protein [Planotetraspora thailandica]GII56874.1 hypothetical protein Pth03_52630 [Planotetraspora thailandica]